MKSYFHIYVYFILLLSVGSIFVFSSSSFIGYIHYNNSFAFYIKQLIAIMLASIIAISCSKISILFFKKYTISIFLFIFFLNILPFIPLIKNPINGAMRWISLFGITFQPSELLKFSYFLHIAL